LKPELGIADYEEYGSEYSEESDDDKPAVMSTSTPQNSIEPMKKSTRAKRQIPVGFTPTFGPDVERTEEGVPIVNESYMDQAESGHQNRFGGFLQKQKLAHEDSEGLRLYEGLVATGNYYIITM